MTKKRILIYILFTYFLTWGMDFVYVLAGGIYESKTMEFILAFSMLIPAISVVFTRIITKEGFKMTGNNSMMLGIHFQDKKWLWLLAALIVPFIWMDMGTALMFWVFPDKFDPSMIESYGLTNNTLFLLPFMVIGNGILVSFGGLGEEIGWRGYLYSKLEEEYGTVKAVIFGGIIWSVWHFPSILQGHNFGHGYWGEPWSGFFVFTVLCIAEGIMLYFFTKKTGSVWVAGFMHAISNSVGAAGVLSVMVSDMSPKNSDFISFVPMVVQILPLLLISIPVTIWMAKRNSDGKEEKEKAGNEIREMV